MSTASEPLPVPLAPTPARVLARRRELADTVTLDLEVVGEGPWRPGQFNMLYAFGVGEIPISISGDPGDGSRLTHTVRDVGMVSRALTRVEPGQTVGVRGPFGSVWPWERATGRDLVIVAGGLGLAPLRGALLAVLAERERFSRVIVMYGSRTPADILFPRELEAWPESFGIEVQITVDAAPPGWKGRVGVVPGLLPAAGILGDRTMALVCGPEVMMRYTVAALRWLGLPESEIWVSMERNMHCGVGLCGHCQLGPHFLCKDGPVFSFNQVSRLFDVKEA